ncbi:MAG: hypothetical protein K0Q51_1465 [Rickettsiaceae bacterium]|jgi:glycosyltransferase involved in cell wall biosynthesis/hydroxymethylpyrimidine pyrophosphatase-like HAD family hydrolase|nr:hypothetical protein [Rickettsiaceae bacterium]
MKILLVTEKCSPVATQWDGGARLVETFKKVFGDLLSIMQFGPNVDSSAKWNFDYPIYTGNRFYNRIENAQFIIENVKKVEEHFTHIIFIHISMQFGVVKQPLREDKEIWTFPMFLTTSYNASGEIVPDSYFKIERETLAESRNILTPSYLEKKQLIEVYGVEESCIHVVPRGVDTDFLKPKVRNLEDYPIFCSIGSIKPQKNILGLIDLFSMIKTKYPKAQLKIIGPVQNNDYFEKVLAKSNDLGLNEDIKFTGHISPSNLAAVIDDCHIHLSSSTCETFGRSIFETLASGLPNIARLTNNAAAEFLQNLPYAYFVDQDKKALEIVDLMLINLQTLSLIAMEIGELYDEKFLAQMLISKICKRETIAISDFDGTLFHKESLERTNKCIKNFMRYKIRVICSARTIGDIIDVLKYHQLEVDWIIGYSGAVICDGSGKVIWSNPLNMEDVEKLKYLSSNLNLIKLGNEVLQVSVNKATFETNFLSNYREINPLEHNYDNLSTILGLRSESYQDTTYIAKWKSSKLQAIIRLLRYLNWSGQVMTFGDGPYDIEFIRYFDGVLITNNKSDHRHKKEIEYV